MKSELQIKNLDLDPQFSRASSGQEGLSMGWLLRLFRSEFFDAWMAVSYLYRYRENHGVLDYLCNELYGVEYADLERYLPQISHMIVHHMKGNPTVERFIMDKCSSSVHFALQMYWFLEAAVEDAVAHTSSETDRVRKLKTYCEMSTVNGPTNMKTEDAVEMEKATVAQVEAQMTSPKVPKSMRTDRFDDYDEENVVPLRRTRSVEFSDVAFPQLGGRVGQYAPARSSVRASPPGSDDEDDNHSSLRSFNTLPINGAQQPKVLPLYDRTRSESELRSISARSLRNKLESMSQVSGDDADQEIAKALKLLTLKQERFDYFNDCVKLMRRLVRISLGLRDVPEAHRKARLTEDLEELNDFILNRMCQELDDRTIAAVLRGTNHAFLRGPHIPLLRSKDVSMRILRFLPDECLILSTRQRAPYMLFVEAVRGELINCDGNIFCEHLITDSMRYPAMPRKKLYKELHGDAEREKTRKDLLTTVFGELWEDRETRILTSSPFKSIPNRNIYAFIVKAGDDLRQEQLAVQLIKSFASVFEKERVSAILRPFTIICLNSDAGLVELVPNAVSIHTVKKRTPEFKTLRDFFERAFGPVSSKRFGTAQKNFIESMAGYSLVSYFLQLKDRHNGNIMLDSSGCIVHIDFGFMLSNYPGAFQFETAPFKLNEELLEVMGGLKSRGFKYFRELFTAGFFAARKHHDIFMTLVEIMVDGTRMPCMKGGKSLVVALRKRFFLGIPEKEATSKINALIDESCNNWRTDKYDKYQYMTNGIL
mmetsp:Transcript_3344/g.10191  ORF Transcript_3344/g.10191 Transcript_3344/m.10191 type:complete len:766 (+) Transcript_3344:232-2529(+)|eukprot:CAMPEP_0198735652 /NCGR_PEP_ID=MMETSP1475-20131203/61158_1 /TAXON_ID= ORGANISM="Unidentified sp., Strain CCMP1999" /NCGR_SAMPLE_ID=MMETSP1475 /ASSEMBLY_ACC=CAM_ASM_001111 /LENGTH=765 /DNA_ID=CAMNT_0044499349 /DNA_START=133 /DNA_END=2430 /DNA_ORIENTATION=+